MVQSLIRDPHRNLRIFLDGKTVHSNETFLQRDELQRILYPEVSIDSLLIITKYPTENKGYTYL